MRIASILNEKEITLSCEVFPPKHFDGIAQASAVAQEIAGLHPSFMSVTYGAAGSTPGHTIAVAKAVAETGVTPLCHLTCVQSTREHVQHVLADMKTAGMENVLALRGDLPKEGEPCHDFAYAAELIDFIHQQGGFLCWGSMLSGGTPGERQPREGYGLSAPEGRRRGGFPDDADVLRQRIAVQFPVSDAARGNGYSGLRGHHADLRRAAGGTGGEAVRVDYAAAVCGDCRPFRG